MLIYGVRGHDFGKMPMESLAKAIAEKGYYCLQLALAKALSDVDSTTGKLSVALAQRIAQTFSRHGVSIAVLGCYINPLHPDTTERAKGMARFKEHLRYAHGFGTRIVGTETGSVRADYGRDPENQSATSLDTLIRSVAELTSEAERFGTILCIEAVTSHVVSTPKRMHQVLTAVASNNLQVIFDPVNLLDATNWQRQDDVFREAFELFGDRIQVLHAKDVVLTDGVPRVVPVGQGCVNYRLVIDLLRQAKSLTFALLEDTKPQFLDDSRIHLQQLVEAGSPKDPA
jgi:sugar phosphate isomerase/epimerase